MSRVPRPAPGCDIRSLPLKPMEAYLFSRIDASTNERELASLTGMSLLDVTQALDRLHQLGAILFEGDLEPLRPRGQPAAEARRDASTDGGARPAGDGARAASGAVNPPPQIGRSALLAGSTSPPLYDPAEIDELVDLDPEKKRRILDAYHRLDDLTHYELLGVHELVDKKQIKSAYYVVAPEFHPDRFFRKNLGSYKQKIEAIFSRLTLAHDVLTNKQKRVEYDEYLEQTHKNRTMSALLEQTPRDIAAVESAVEEKAQAMVASSPSVPPSPGRYDSPQPEDVQARRETFARKLAGGAFRPGGSLSSAPPPRPSSPPPQAAAEALKARFEWARDEAKRQQIARFVEAGRAALERKDFAAAANSYRIAASLAPQDAQLQRSSADVNQQAAVALAGGFLKQANYEAAQERWQEAALSYAKAATGMPDNALVHERVALATLMSSGNARRAIDFARKAVELSPKEAEFHVTLARAYFAAGLEKSAQGELDRAAELAPKDSRIRDLIKLAQQAPSKTDKTAKA